MFVKVYGDAVSVGASGFETGLDEHFFTTVFGDPGDVFFHAFGGV
jgi:hypothetical protein